MHELATNSLKYGSLSSDVGVLDVSGSVVGDCVRVVWTEHGGPAVGLPDGQHGYGGAMMPRSVRDTLDGTISYDWLDTGAVVTLELNADRLSS